MSLLIMAGRTRLTAATVERRKARLGEMKNRIRLLPGWDDPIGAGPKSQYLPPAHKDPFDRMLIAQASAESCLLVTTDREILKYKTKHIRVIG